MSLKNKNILITCGPTWVPMDAVRVISNQSTGKLGQTIASDFMSAGAKVTLLEGPVAKRFQSRSAKVLKFVFFDEFTKLLKRELRKNYDACVHAAAVADYKVKNPRRTKLPSSRKALRLKLTPTPKIIHQIKRLSPKIFLIGFKLEPKMSEISARLKSRALFQKDKCDLVIANSSNGRKYSGYILDRTGKCVARKQSRKTLSKALIKIMKEHL